MGKNILVASSKIEFNELLRLNLEESGDFSVFFATTGEETLKTAETESFSLIILDAELTETPIQTFYLELKKKHPRLRTIIIPPQNNSEHPSLAEIDADGYLSIPFFKPNLLELIENVLSKEESTIQPVDLPGDEPAIDPQTEKNTG